MLNSEIKIKTQVQNTNKLKFSISRKLVKYPLTSKRIIKWLQTEE